MNAIEIMQIPETRWPQFCESFTRQHHGWLVNISQLQTEKLAQDETPERMSVPMLSGTLPLQEVREGRRDDRVEFMVTMGEGKDETSLLIEDAIALFSRKVGDAHQGLRIDSDNGMTTLIEFRIAAEPESLDGLAASEL